MTLKEMLARKKSLELEIIELKERIRPELELLEQNLRAVETTMTQVATDQLKAVADKDTGTYHFTCDTVLITATISKRVKWDQGKLREIRDKIIAASDDPDQYLKTEFTVPENAYKNWPKVIQQVFLPARTVVPGPPKFEFTDENDIPF